jgi:hypothetical protein
LQWQQKKVSACKSSRCSNEHFYSRPKQLTELPFYAIFCAALSNGEVATVFIVVGVINSFAGSKESFKQRKSRIQGYLIRKLAFALKSSSGAVFEKGLGAYFAPTRQLHA